MKRKFTDEEIIKMRLSRNGRTTRAIKNLSCDIFCAFVEGHVSEKYHKNWEWERDRSRCRQKFLAKLAWEWEESRKWKDACEFEKEWQERRDECARRERERKALLAEIDAKAAKVKRERQKRSAQIRRLRGIEAWATD